MKIGDTILEQNIYYTAKVNIALDDVLQKISKYMHDTYYKYIYFPESEKLFDTTASKVKVIKSYIYKRYGIKLAPDDINKIQLELNHLKDDGLQISFILTKDMDWSPGDFSDNGSCFFSFNKGARKLISSNDGYFIKFYDGDKRFGRCQALPGFIKDKKCSNTYTFFNSFMISDNTIAEIMSNISSSKYVINRITNKGTRGDERSVLYSNTPAVIVGPDCNVVDCWYIDERPYETYRCEYCDNYFVLNEDPCGKSKKGMNNIYYNNTNKKKVKE